MKSRTLSHPNNKAVSSIRFLQAKSLRFYLETRQTNNRNRKNRAQQSFGCFIHQLRRKDTPDEQVIPLTKY